MVRDMDWFVDRLLSDPASVDRLYAIATGRRLSDGEVPSWFVEGCMGDAEFIARVTDAIREQRAEYFRLYREFLTLEEREGYPATKWCCEVLDEIAQCIPVERRTLGHVPVSGLDFYWARIFDTTCFEDVAFDAKECVNAWWEIERYSREGRTEVIQSMIRAGALTGREGLSFVSRDSHVPHAEDVELNRPDATLIVAGGHDVLGFLDDRFGVAVLLYGAVVTVNPYLDSGLDLVVEMEKRGYKKVHFTQAGDYLLPFAIGFENITVFLKQ